ncbi:MAG: trypsin-like peptidase domain-containing protein [Firmicutes bacterium]|nr:trypsin-like peptidase domain-containing protein [Bacillota bacterium]
MKKLILFSVFISMSLVLVACSSVSALETTTTPVTTIPDTTLYTGQETTLDGEIYVYEDYQDLVDQIYQDIYDDIYAEISLELADMITFDLYEEIYQMVENNISEILSSEEISVYVRDFQQLIYNVVEVTNTSVVGVTSYGIDSSSVGSAVVYKHDILTDTYYVVTNNHVVDEGQEFSVVFSDESSVDATLLGVDADVDIAILSFSGVGLDNEITVSPFGDSDLVEQGSIVITAGNPQGYNFYGSVTMGIVSGVNRDVYNDGVVLYIQHDASINNGNSGGPLYNINGEVIGINVIKLSDLEIEGMGFSIPINMVKTIISEIEAPYVG